MKQFDLIVIGGGPAGYVAAIKAAQLGKRVALAEAREVGGTCLNRGCVPTKSLLHAAELYQAAKTAAEYGIMASDVAFDYAVMAARKDQTVAALRGGIQTLLGQNDVAVLPGRAVIQKPGCVTVDGEPVSAQNILIATGSVPATPLIPGIECAGVVDSDALLLRTNCPARLVIVGGGVIGTEFAGLYAMLGADVTVLEAQARILPQLDVELSRSAAALLKKQGVRIVTDAHVDGFAQYADGGDVECTYSMDTKTTTICADTVLVATGRRANTERLFAPGFSVEERQGFVITGADGKTSADGIYAAGDVVFGAPQLAHAASAMGENAVCAMFGQRAAHDISVVPSCIYTSPEIACVGLAEKEAQAAGYAIAVGKYVMSGNARTAIATAARGFIKLVFDAHTEQLLGAQLLCERATDIISELAMAVHNKLTARCIAETIRPHPTFAEGITEATHAAFGNAVHMPPRR